MPFLRSLRPSARVAALLCALALPLAGCAATSDDPTGSAADGDNDPLEGVNRAVHGFNEGLDILVIGPASEVYRGVVPDPIRTAVRNFLYNLTSPLLIANNLLQGDWAGAERATGRMLVNTTIGLGGLIDVAGEAGIPYEYEDFGQTLAVWGVPDGPYLVLPVLGPSSVRDAFGLAVDNLADPFTLWATGSERDSVLVARGAAVTLDTRLLYAGAISDIRRNSLDPYAALRSLYRQRRTAEIRDGAVQAEFPDYPEFPEFDDLPVDGQPGDGLDGADE